MEVHNNLGAGFLEIEFRNAEISYEREKMFEINYKGNILRHKFYADFIINENIILEVKGKSGITEEFVAQAINYLKVSNNKLAIIVNFGEQKLNFKRIVL